MLIFPTTEPFWVETTFSDLLLHPTMQQMSFSIRCTSA
uniref:SPO11A n=1 Tax=Arundo donax TaxID=35708 RepID=A0A0A9AEC7_ARUDO